MTREQSKRLALIEVDLDEQTNPKWPVRIVFTSKDSTELFTDVRCTVPLDPAELESRRLQDGLNLIVAQMPTRAMTEAEILPIRQQMGLE